MNVVNVFSFSGSHAVCLPICLLRLFTGRQTGKAESSCRQTAQWCCCFLWHDGLALSVAILAKLADWRGRSDLGFCFDFLRLLISKWVGWNPAADVTSREQTTRYGYRLSSLLRHAQPTLAPTLSSVVMVTYPKSLFAVAAFWSVYPFRYFVYCWLFGL